MVRNDGASGHTPRSVERVKETPPPVGYNGQKIKINREVNTMDERIKRIVEGGNAQGWSKMNAIISIMYEIATEEETEGLSFFDDMPDLKARAEKLYNKALEELTA